MGRIEELYDDLETEITFEQFRERIDSKIDEMGGLADEETAAMLVAHELDGNRPIPIEDIDPEMESVTVLGVVRHVGERRSFERDDGEQGSVINIEIADDTGSVRAAFWDEMAAAAEEQLDRGDTLRLKARPREGYNGIEISVTDVRSEEDIEVEVAEPDVTAIEDLEPGMEGIALTGEVLRVEPPRTFERDDGTDGKVATVVIGDESGAIGVTLWGDATDATDETEVGDGVNIEGASVRERDGQVEVHVGGRAVLEATDTEVSYDPVGVPINSVTEDDIVTITGIVRSTDPVRTFDRDDGSQGKVRNIQVQDKTGDIRVALWGDRADLDLAPGDEVTCIDVLIKEGFRDDLEASANWRSTIVKRGGDIVAEEDHPSSVDGVNETLVEEISTEESTEFTGTVVQPGDPIILDNGEETVRVEYDGDVQLGERVTVSGTRDGDRLKADSLTLAENPR